MELDDCGASDDTKELHLPLSAFLVLFRQVCEVHGLEGKLLTCPLVYNEVNHTCSSSTQMSHDFELFQSLLIHIRLRRSSPCLHKSHQRFALLESHRLDDIVLSTHLQTVGDGVLRLGRAHHNYRNLRQPWIIPHQGQNFEPVHLRHDQIEQDKIKVILLILKLLHSEQPILYSNSLIFTHGQNV